MLSRVVVEHYFQQAVEWLDRRGGESREWAEKAVVTDHAVYLTADELEQIGAKARALLDPYLERNEDLAARPDGARPVTYIQLGFPLDGG
jgi:hypothetical protein